MARTGAQEGQRLWLSGPQRQADPINRYKMAGVSGEVRMLESIDRALDLFSAAHARSLAEALPFQILVGTVALAVLWVLWIVLRVSLAAFRGL